MQKVLFSSQFSFWKARNTFNTAWGDDANHYCSLTRRSSGRTGDFEVFGFNKSKMGDCGASCKTRARVEVVARAEVKRAKRTLMQSGLQHSMVRVWSSSLVAMHLVSRRLNFSPYGPHCEHKLVPNRWSFLEAPLCQRCLPTQRTVCPRGRLSDKSYLISKNNLLSAPNEKTVKGIIGLNYLYCHSI